MEKVAWISRHPPLPKQLRVLMEKLGEIEIVHISNTFRDAHEVLKEVRSIGAKYAVVVLPLSMIAVLTQYKDITWLWAEMFQVHDGDCIGYVCPNYNPESDVILKSVFTKRHLRFNKFYKIKEVQMIFEDW